MFNQDNAPCLVVANHEEQYSIWPATKPVPTGWMKVGVEGEKSHCLEYIDTVWSDMRPRSLRLEMGASKEVSAQVQGVVREVTSRYPQEAQACQQGKPELFGWLLAKVVAADATLNPQDVRDALDQEFPLHLT